MFVSLIPSFVDVEKSSNFCQRVNNIGSQLGFVCQRYFARHFAQTQSKASYISAADVLFSSSAVRDLTLGTFSLILRIKHEHQDCKKNSPLARFRDSRLAHWFLLVRLVLRPKNEGGNIFRTWRGAI